MKNTLEFIDMWCGSSLPGCARQISKMSELMDVNIGEDVPLQVLGNFSCCCCMILKYGLDGEIDMLLIKA